MKQTLAALLAVGTLIAGTQRASAVTYNLDDLISSGASITIGDKVFDDFNLTGFDPGGVTVTPSISGGVYYLTFGGGFVNNGSDPLSDSQLFYTVATTSGQPLLTMIDQAFNLTAAGNGGVIGIGETVRVGGFGGTKVAQSSLSYVFGVVDSEDPVAEVIQGDDLFINPAVSKVWVTKDIFLDAAPGGVVGATIIAQSFHQSAPDGGATAALLGAGFLGLSALARRKS